MSEFQAILQAKHAKDWDLLTELSLTRVYQYFTSSASKSFALLSAYRTAEALDITEPANPEERRKKVLGVNRKRNQALKADVDALGFGYSKLLGRWSECSDSTYEYDDCPEELKVPGVEESLFITGISLDDTVRLLAKYDQDAGVYMGPDTEKAVWLLFKNGSHRVLGTTFSPNTVAAAYSQLKGHSTFRFEYVAQSYQEALIEDTFRRNHPSPLRTDIAALRDLVKDKP